MQRADGNDDNLFAVFQAALTRLKPHHPVPLSALAGIAEQPDIRAILPQTPSRRALLAARDRLLAGGSVHLTSHHPEALVFSADAAALAQAAVERWNATDPHGRDLGVIVGAALRDHIAGVLWGRERVEDDGLTRSLLLPHIAQIVLEGGPSDAGWANLLFETAQTLIELAPELFVDAMLVVIERFGADSSSHVLRAIGDNARRFLKRRPRHPAAFAVARVYREAHTRLREAAAAAYGGRSRLLAAPLIALATALDTTGDEAVTLMEQARDLDGASDDPRTWYHIGRAYARVRRIGEAASAYDRARALAEGRAPYLAARVKLGLATLTEPIIAPEQAEHTRALLREVVAAARRFIAEGTDIAEEADEPLDPAQLLLLDALVALIWQSLFTDQLPDTLSLIEEALRVANSLLDEDHPIVLSLEDWQGMARKARRRPAR